MTCADDDLAWRVENHRSAAISLLTQVRDSVNIGSRRFRWPAALPARVAALPTVARSLPSAG